MILRFSAEKNEASSKIYSLSNDRVFLYRSANTGFFNKWCGVWKPPYKMYEYFAFKINDEWLSPENMKRFVSAPWFSAHKYKLRSEKNDKIEIDEILFAPDGKSAIVVLIRLKNSDERERVVKVSAEVSINIRRKNEEFNLRKYEARLDDKRKCVLVKSEDDNYVCFGSDFKEESLEIKIKEINFYKEHFPGGELQRCFIPADYTVEFVLNPGETYYLPFVFSCGFSKQESLDSFDECVSNWKNLLKKKVERKIDLIRNNYFICDSEKVSKLFTASVMNLDDFLYSVEDGKYLIAGYPWFIEAWDRDDLWSCFGLVALGWFDEAADILEFFTRFSGKRMPCTVVVDKKKIVTSYHGAGVDPLFLIVLDHLRSMSGRKWKKFNAAEREVLRHLVLENYLVLHGPKETWMDSIERKGTAVEIQGMWVKALERRDGKLAEKMKKAFKNKFWNKETSYPFDSYANIPNGKVTPNCFVPAIFGLYSGSEIKKIILKAREELESECGIRTLSKKDRTYNPAGYHTGSTWGLTTLWGAALYFKGGLLEEGMALMEKLAEDLSKLHVGFVAEVWHSESSDCIGATAQLWSTSLVPYIIDEFLLGIKWDDENKALVLAPKVPEKWKIMKRGIKRVREFEFEIEIRRVVNGYEMILEFVKKAPPSCVFIPPSGIKKIFINGKEFKGKGATFVPLKKNIIRVVKN